MFADGAELANATFEKMYLVDSLAAQGDVVVLTVSENLRINSINWIGEEMTGCGFF